MAIAKNYVEYSEDLQTRYTGAKAIIQRVKRRLSVYDGEIPYHTGALPSYFFNYGITNDLMSSLRLRLGDISSDISLTQDGHVIVAGVSVKIPQAEGSVVL